MKGWIIGASSALIWALACVGCQDSDDERPPALDQTGDPCRTTKAMCITDELALECLESVWTERSCDETCDELGPQMLSEGCVQHDVQGWPVEECICVAEPGACTPGESACESATELGYCEQGQVWEIYNCAEVCAQSLATPVPIGCDVGEDGMAACWCSSS